MASIWNANFRSSSLCWTYLLHRWVSGTQNRSVKRLNMQEALGWLNSLLKVVVNSQSWICFRKQLNTLVKGRFTSMTRGRYCLCLRIPQPGGWAGRCLAVRAPPPLPPSLWVGADAELYRAPYGPGEGWVCRASCPPLLIARGAVMGETPGCFWWKRTLTLLPQPREVLCWGILFPEEPSCFPAVWSGISHGPMAFLACNESFTGGLLQIHIGGSTKGVFSFLQGSFIFQFFL